VRNAIPQLTAAAFGVRLALGKGVQVLSTASKSGLVAFFVALLAVTLLPANAGTAPPGGGGVSRATSSLGNPIQFYQYGQITGVGPIHGTVAIYNQFGQEGMAQNPFAGLGGLGGQQGGGMGGGGGGGATQGDDGPQGVLLHVNYANMFLPNQQQINNGGGNTPGGGYGALGRGYPGGFGFGYPGFGGFGGFPGFGGVPPGGFGKGAFGNGASGL
jgi:hypothetical protein